MKLWGAIGPFVIAIALCLPPASAAAQSRDATGNASICGQANAPDLGAGLQLIVELWRTEAERMVDSQLLTRNGQFEFRGLPHGSYELRVTNSVGAVIRRQLVMLSSGSTFVSLDLPGPRREQRNISPTVSVAALSHRAPAKARREYKRASTAHAKGDLASEIQSLQKALGIDPAYIEAYNQLGVAYLAQGKHQEACDMFQAGVHLDSGSSILQTNLAVAYAALGRFEEAEKAARTSLRLNSTASNTRFVLGVALTGQRREPEEALANLTAAASEFPQARLIAAQILVGLGQKVRALAELRKYLSLGLPRDRQKVENWVAKLLE